MVAAIANVDNTHGAINILCDWTGNATVSGHGLVHLKRVLIDGTVTEVRGSPVIVSGGFALFWDDEAPLNTPVQYITSSDLVTGIATSAAVTITGSGGDIGWLKDPVEPTRDVAITMTTTPRDCITTTGQVQFVSLSDETLVSSTGVFGIINDPRPSTIAMLRKAPTMSLVITSQELTDITLLETLFATGRNLLLQLPTKYGWALATFGTDYITCQDVTKARLPLANMARPERVWTIPFALGRVPPSPTGLLGSNGIGVGKATWGGMAASGLTYNQLNLTAKTVGQLSQGQGY